MEMSSSRLNPLVSVVLTTYNGEKYLHEQLDSIVNQTHCNLEILVCDDASTDSTPQIIREYAARDARITPVLHAQNIGLHANLESGLRAARGDYLAISDQDDIWLPEKIALLLQHIGNHLAIFSDSQLIDEHGDYFDHTLMDTLKIKDKKNCLSLISLLEQNVVSGHALLFRKELLAMTVPFKPSLIFDHHLALVASAFDHLLFYPTPLVLHRLHASNSVNGELLRKMDPNRNKKETSLEDKLERVRGFEQKFSLLLELGLLSRDRPTFLDMESNRLLFSLLERLVSELKKFDQVFFNFPLFRMLLQLRKHYPETGTFKLSRCFRLSKGRKWYALFNGFYTTKSSLLNR
jgi:glycosyltransferase involved in cell wall biosynthesis